MLPFFGLENRAEEKWPMSAKLGLPRRSWRAPRRLPGLQAAAEPLVMSVKGNQEGSDLLQKGSSPGLGPAHPSHRQRAATHLVGVPPQALVGQARQAREAFQQLVGEEDLPGTLVL